MDGSCTLCPPKCKFLTPFKRQNKYIYIFSAIYAQDAIMIQAENNDISLTDHEFSNVTGHKSFMEDVNVAVQFCPWFTFYFPLFLGYDNI